MMIKHKNGENDLNNMKWIWSLYCYVPMRICFIKHTLCCPYAVCSVKKYASHPGQ